jgi:prophage DNA circulation protein
MIPAFEVTEGAKVATLVADMLLATSNNQIGRAGADLRRACGDMKAYAENYIVANVIGPKLSDCFTQARVTGATMMQFDEIRKAVLDESVTSLIGTLIKNSCVGFCLQQISIVLAGITFTSRQDVDRVRAKLHPAFDAAEEVAADEMALVVYRTLVALHAAVTFHLYETARPLPQMLNFEFAATRPTLIQSYRLYATAARADELRRENKVVHPAFAPRAGQALAF